MRQGAVVVAAAAMILTTVHAAEAAVVTNVAGTLTYTATSGEANRLEIEQLGSSVVVTDSGADFLFGLPGCRSIAAGSLRCDGVALVSVALGDGDDILRASVSLRTEADGGPGDDWLVAGAGDDELAGGAGHDRLDGGAGSDDLDGAGGEDMVDYTLRTGPVIVTLDGVENDGAPGELDLVVGVENVHGGSGNDVVDGDGEANEIAGGAGDDSLGGGDGADSIDGGEGQDGVNALDPPNADGEPASSGPGEDQVSCGGGRDRVYGDDPDGVGGDCEQVSRGAVAGISVGSRVAPAAPPPVLGQSVVLAPVSGVVLVSAREPGTPPRQRQDVPAAPAVPLSGETNVLVGSVVDTRYGTVELTVATDRTDGTESAVLHSGPFQVFQDDVVGSVTDLELRGGKDFADCPAGQKGPGTARASRRRRPVRRLWARAKGNFRTSGRFASATVRGTKWLTADRCDGTLVAVREGAVAVGDLARGTSTIVRAGQRKLIRR